MKPQFTLRDLLWLTVVVGLAIGWWLDRSRLQEKFESAVEVAVGFGRILANNNGYTIEWKGETVVVTGSAGDAFARSGVPSEIRKEIPGW